MCTKIETQEVSIDFKIYRLGTVGKYEESHEREL